MGALHERDAEPVEVRSTAPRVGFRQTATAEKQNKPAGGEAMRIRIVHSEQMGCEPKCAEWISAEGKIVLGTAEQLRKAVNSVYPRKLPILIHSSGGLISDAILMGILIRSRRLDLGVARTVFEPCSDAPVDDLRAARRVAATSPNAAADAALPRSLDPESYISFKRGPMAASPRRL
jgi:hypothetical protein